MFIYNVTIKVALQRAEEWLQWMRQKHIPDVMETGCFTKHRLCRLLENDTHDGITYIIQYTCNHLNDFSRYVEKHAPSLQKEHLEKFGDDVAAFRTVMEVL
jgi:hypothetical protein